MRLSLNVKSNNYLINKLLNTFKGRFSKPETRNPEI